MSNLTTAQKLAILFVAWLVLGGGSIGAPPPFKTDRLCVLVVEETANRGQLSSGQRDAIEATGPGSVRGYVESRGGDFQPLDVDTADDLQFSPQWIKDAFAVKRDSLPWIVAADSRTGFSEPLVSAGDALAKLEKMGGK